MHIGERYSYLTNVSKSGSKETLVKAGGEFRIVAANLLWMKVADRYHHQYLSKGGQWDKNESLLPLLKTIIELDPHFVQAYMMMGGTILPRTGHIEEGKRILSQGIKNNPNEWELYREMAMLYAWNEKKPVEALPYAQEGLAQTKDDFSRNIMSRLCHTLEEQINHLNVGKRSKAS